MKEQGELEEQVLAKGWGRLERLVESGAMSQEEAEERNLARREQGPEAAGPPTPRVCEVTFDVRKPFIDHCQSVHGMRFKTKRGLRIPPPPVPEAQDRSPDSPIPSKPGD